MRKEDVSPFELGGVNPVIQYFSGASWLARLTGPEDQVDISNVTFEPGCRNNWHVHHGAQQILVCVGGEGWYQEWGKEAVPMTPGTIIAVPAEVKHWHGAAPDSWFSHLAIEVPGEETGNEWLEAVDEAAYMKLK